MIEFDSEAAELHNIWYCEQFEEKKNIGDDALKAIAEGRDNHLKKAAMVFACLDPKQNLSEPRITAEHWEHGKIWADYVLACQRNIFTDYAPTHASRVEQKIKTYLAKQEQWVLLRTLYRSLSLSAKEVREACEALSALNVVELSDDVKQVRLVDDDTV